MTLGRIAYSRPAAGTVVGYPSAVAHAIRHGKAPLFDVATTLPYIAANPELVGEVVEIVGRRRSVTPTAVKTATAAY
jgi:hypothetical protein